MPTIEELAVNNDGVLGDNIENLEEVEEVQPNGSPLDGILKFIMIETGEGSIEEYINHPLNFLESKGLAQIIRGVSGFVGNSLKLAVVDVIFGFMRMKNEKGV